MRAFLKMVALLLCSAQLCASNPHPHATRLISSPAIQLQAYPNLSVVNTKTLLTFSLMCALSEYGL